MIPLDPHIKPCYLFLSMDVVLHALIKIAEKIRTPEESLMINTTELGDILGVSQQTASRYLNNLVEEGYITKNLVKDGQEIRLTSKAIDVLKSIHSNLERLMVRPDKDLMIEGKIVSGIGQGAHYVRKYSERLEKHTGYLPYPGTLNVHVNPRPDLSRYVSDSIEEFKEEGRTFGKLDLIPVRVSYKKKSIRCHLIIPERTHHKNDFEILCEHNMRDKYGLKDNDIVGLKINH